MLKKLILGAAALTVTATIMPASAEAGHRYQRHYGGYYDPYYRGVYHDPYYRGGYDRGYYGRGYYGRTYGYRDPYYGRRSYRRCGSGTTGAIVGGAAGALLGREVARGGSYYRYRGRGNGTVGAIIGGAAGALIGREIGRAC